MSKLCQIIAVEKSTKNKAHQVKTDAYQNMQKVALLTGISRTYQPRDEGGEVFPSEHSKVQLSLRDTIASVSRALVDLFDVVATKDWTNCAARADVSVGDVVLAKGVPVTYLLFLEKQLVDIHTFVSKLPTLDPTEDWAFDSNVNCWVSKSAETVKTKKVFVPLVLSPATDKHPAQVKEGFDDRVVGSWKTVKFSGAMPAQVVAEMLDRVEKLQRAIKFAREEANALEVSQQKVGEKILSYIFG